MLRTSSGTADHQKNLYCIPPVSVSVAFLHRQTATKMATLEDRVGTLESNMNIMFLVTMGIIVFRECSHHVHVMFTVYSHHVHITLISCSHHVHTTFLSCSHHVHTTFLSCSHHVHTTFLSCSHHVHSKFTSFSHHV